MTTQQRNIREIYITIKRIVRFTSYKILKQYKIHMITQIQHKFKTFKRKIHCIVIEIC